MNENSLRRDMTLRLRHNALMRLFYERIKWVSSKPPMPGAPVPLAARDVSEGVAHTTR